MTLFLQQAAKPLLSWPRVPIELFGFLAAFGVLGPIAFRYVVARSLIGRDDQWIGDATRGAARIGIAGALIGLVNLVASTIDTAVTRNLSFAQAAARGGLELHVALALLIVLVVAFAMARTPSSGAWVVALVAGLAYALRDTVPFRWSGLVNPLHRFGSSIWIGTLFVLFAAAVPAVMRRVPAGESRDRAVAHLVNAFSPLALIGGGFVVVFGVITAVTHLKTVPALWSTPYGIALLVKLAFVAIVFGLGAWNWRRIRPQLGEERATSAIRRSARSELLIAGIVLLVTAVLVSLPTPRRPKPAGAASAPSSPAAPAAQPAPAPPSSQ